MKNCTDIGGKQMNMAGLQQHRVSEPTSMLFSTCSGGTVTFRTL